LLTDSEWVYTGNVTTNVVHVYHNVTRDPLYQNHAKLKYPNIILLTLQQLILSPKAKNSFPCNKKMYLNDNLRHVGFNGGVQDCLQALSS